MIVPILAIAGSMVRKQRVAPSLGTFPTYGPLWVGLLVGVILIVGALDLLPRPGPGPDRRAPAAGSGADLLRGRPRIAMKETERT